MSPNEERVLKALADPHWDWRTLPALESVSELSREEILEILSLHNAEIETSSTVEHGVIFRLKQPQPAHACSTIENMLEYISFGARR